MVFVVRAVYQPALGLPCVPAGVRYHMGGQILHGVDHDFFMGLDHDYCMDVHHDSDMGVDHALYMGVDHGSQKSSQKKRPAKKKSKPDYVQESKVQDSRVQA